MMIKRHFGLTVLATMLTLGFMFSMAFSARAPTLAWNPSPDAGVSGYNLYYGTSPGMYGQMINVGQVTSYTVSSLSEGTIYYFAVKAYDASGVESDPSNEISYQTPGNTAPTIASIPNASIYVNEQTGALQFRVSDLETAASNLTVSAGSANVVLVPQSSIFLAGNNGQWTIQIRPTANQTGSALITVYANDGVKSGSTSFILTVNPPLLDSTYTATSGFTLNRNLGIISANVSTLPADPKSVYWAKSGLSVLQGQNLVLSGQMYSSVVNAPVSVYLVDEATGYWLTPERVIYVDSNYGYYQTDLIVFDTSASAKLYVSCGFRTGTYEFQGIGINLFNEYPAPVNNLYLRQLLLKQQAGLFSAEWYWDAVPGSEGYMIRLALSRAEIEKGAAGNLLAQQLLPPAQTAYRQDIVTNLYSGVYFSVSSVITDQDTGYMVESTPWTTWYLPGQVTNTADAYVPPLCVQASVTTNDVNLAYAGYLSNTNTPALIPGQPAGLWERMDIDNNGKAGRVSDYSFIRSQNLNGRRMQP